MTLITTIILSLGLILGSPDGRLSVELNSTSSSNICYSVAYDGNTVILPSKLGIHTNNADYTVLSYIGHETELIDVNYSLDRIKTGKVSKEAMRTVVHFQTPDGRKIDQLRDVIEMIRNHPDSRRMLVCAWNPGEIDKMALPPCHCLFQFYVADGKLSCQLYQRSADTFLGVPFNIASYALLTMMIAQDCGLGLGEFIHTTGDTHIYLNHFDQVREQLSRSPRALPKMKLNPEVKSVFDFKYEDFTLEEYDPWPAIKAPVSV